MRTRIVHINTYDITTKRVSGSIVIGSLAAEVFGDTLLGVFSGVLTFLVIVFAEILPKTLAEQHAQRIALIMAIPVRGMTWVMTPFVVLLERITAPFTRRGRLPTTNETEIKLLASIGYQEGIIEADEAEMIRRVFRLNDITAAQIMTPDPITLERGMVAAKALGVLQSRKVSGAFTVEDGRPQGVLTVLKLLEKGV